MTGFAADSRFADTPPGPGKPGPEGTHARLFVAVDVGEAVRAEAARVIEAISTQIEAAEAPPRVTWVKPSALHVTLRFIGDVDERTIPALCERLAPPWVPSRRK